MFESFDVVCVRSYQRGRSDIESKDDEFQIGPEIGG